MGFLGSVGVQQGGGRGGEGGGETRQVLCALIVDSASFFHTCTGSMCMYVCFFECMYAAMYACIYVRR